MKVAQLSIAVILLATASPGSTQQRYLKGIELRATIEGKTLFGKEWAEYYSPSGTILGKVRVFGIVQAYSAKWSAGEDRICYDYEGTAYDTCSQLIADGEAVTHFAMAGTLKRDGVARWKFGNSLSAF